MESEKTQPSQPAESFDIYKWMAWVHANRNAVITGVVAVAIIGSALGIYSWKKGQDELEANAKLFALPSAFGGGEKAVHPSAEAFLNVAKEYPSTSIGEQAQLLAAGTLFTQANSAEGYKKAKAAFSDFLRDHPDSQLAAQASIGIAASAEASGDTNAIALYQQAIAKYSNEGIAEPAKLTVGRLFEEQNNPAAAKEALKYYDELARSADYRSPWVSEAQERKTLLLAKYPQLAPAPAPVLPSPSATPAPAPAIKAAPAAQPQAAPTKTK